MVRSHQHRTNRRVRHHSTASQGSERGGPHSAASPRIDKSSRTRAPNNLEAMKSMEGAVALTMMFLVLQIGFLNNMLDGIVTTMHVVEYIDIRTHRHFVWSRGHDDGSAAGLATLSFRYLMFSPLPTQAWLTPPVLSNDRRYG